MVTCHLLLRIEARAPANEKTFGIVRLDAFVNAVPRHYLPLTDEALRLEAELWAKSRQVGRPTAGPISARY